MSLCFQEHGGPTRVTRSVEKWESRLLHVNRQPKHILIPLLLQELEIIRHEEARQDESARYPAGPDIRLDVGLSVKMRHVRQPAVRELLDVQERRVDQVFYARLLTGVSYGFALGDLDVPAHGFPEVGYKEDGVGAGYGREGRRDG